MAEMTQSPTFNIAIYGRCIIDTDKYPPGSVLTIKLHPVARPEIPSAWDGNLGTLDPIKSQADLLGPIVIEIVKNAQRRGQL